MPRVLSRGILVVQVRAESGILQRQPQLGNQIQITGGPIRYSWFDLPSPPTPDEQRRLEGIVVHRNSLPINPGLKVVAFHPAKGVTYTGYQYGGVRAAPEVPAADRLHQLALKEFGLCEGGVSAVVTYDTSLSLGAGFANAAALQWMRDWFDSDPWVEVEFAKVGCGHNAACHLDGR